MISRQKISTACRAKPWSLRWASPSSAGSTRRPACVVEKGHELEGQSIAGRVLVFPTGKGSTVGSYTLYRLKKAGLAPAAIVNAECETITAVGCIISEIPCVDHIPIEKIKTGMQVSVDGESGTVGIS